MKYMVPLFAAGALAMTPSVVQRDAEGQAIASAALSSVVAANQALATSISEFVPPNSDEQADAIFAVYNAITDGTTAIQGINPLSDLEAGSLAPFVPQLTDSTKQSVDNTIAAKEKLDSACLGTLTYQVFSELQPLAQGLSDALESKVSVVFQGIIAQTGDQIQAELKRGQDAFADQFPPPCSCGGDCSTTTTTTTSTTSDSTTSTSTSSSETTTTTTTGTETTTTTTSSGTTGPTSGTVSGGWEGWSAIPSSTYTTTKGAQYTTTPKAPVAGGSSWEVISSHAPVYTTPKAPAGGSSWEAITTKAPEHPTSKAPIASYTTTKAPVATYTGAANAGAMMNAGAILLAAGAALL